MVVLHCKTNGALVAAAIMMGANVTTFLTTHTNMPIQVICLCKCNCRRSISHCKSATQSAPQKCVSLLITEAANDLLQWPTSPKWHIFAHHLLDCSIAPPCADLGLCCDRSKPPRGRDVEQSSPRPDWIQNRRRILVDDLRSFRRRRSNKTRR